MNTWFLVVASGLLGWLAQEAVATLPRRWRIRVDMAITAAFLWGLARLWP